MSEDRKDITFEVEVEDVPADEQIPADEQVSEGEGAYPDNIDEVKEELAKAAERVAGSIGHLAAKKGEEIADSIDEFNENTSIKNLFGKKNDGEGSDDDNADDSHKGGVSGSTIFLIILAIIAVNFAAYKIYSYWSESRSLNTSGIEWAADEVKHIADTKSGEAVKAAEEAAEKARLAAEEEAENAKPSYNLHLEVTFKQNILFSIYDADIFVGDKKVGVVSQGKTFSGDVEVKEGEREIKFTKTGVPDICGKTSIDMTDDYVFSCDLTAYATEITLLNQRFETKEEYFARLAAEEEARKAAEEQAEEEQNAADSYPHYDVTTLEMELFADPDAAREKYLGTYIEVTGVVDIIDSDTGFLRIRDPNNPFDLVGVICYFVSEDQKQQVSKISSGSELTVGGKMTIVGGIIGFAMDLDYVR